MNPFYCYHFQVSATSNSSSTISDSSMEVWGGKLKNEMQTTLAAAF